MNAPLPQPPPPERRRVTVVGLLLAIATLVALIWFIASNLSTDNESAPDTVPVNPAADPASGPAPGAPE